MAYIENLEEIKSKLDPESVINLLIPEKKKKRSGKELRTCCPVHGGYGTENFSINLDTHQWICHSHQCKGVNLIDLYAQSKKIKFLDAAEELANRFGIKIEHRTVNTTDRKYTQETVLKSWNEATSQGKDEYFFKKGLQPPSIAKFGKNANGYHSTMIPYRDIEGKLLYLLCISGKKHQYKVEDDIKGAFALLGTIETESQYYIGEGIATVQTAWEASNQKIPAISAGSWSNMLDVVSAIKSKYPNSKPIVLIDCDDGENGLKAAKMISEKFPEATYRKPNFDTLPIPSNTQKNEFKDFNDILSKCSLSLDEVRKQLTVDFDISSVKISSKNEALKKSEDQVIKNDSKTHGRCETAAEALKKLGFIERVKTRKLEYEKSGAVKISGVQTQFNQLDNILDGLQGGHLIILAGRTGMGKTFVALNMLKNIAIDQKIPAALYSLEMSNTQVFYRLASLISGIPATKIKRGTITDKELEEVENAVKLIENSPLFMTDEPSNSTLNILSANMHRSCKSNGVQAIFIDHIGLVNCGNNYKDNRANEMGEITMTAKITAKQHNVPIICLAQLNREADKKEPPKLSQLRESGNLEQDADIVIFVHRRDYYDKADKPGQVEIIVEKNRDGEPGKVICEYGKPTWLIKEFPPIASQIPNDLTTGNIVPRRLRE
jgi:replicative DNA helicase